MITLGEFILWIVYFISLYFTVFWLLVFLEHEEKINKTKKRLSTYPFVSIAIPAYNEEETIKATLESCLNLNYPKDKLEIIVVNDGSTDRTREIVEGIRENLEHKKLLRLINQENKGKATSLNLALKQATGKFFVCLDADSIVEEDALAKMIPEFETKEIAVVLPLMKAARPENLLQRLQYIEYLINIFYKKIMGFLDCIHVAPGPFSVYRRDVLLKIGGYDETSITEDLEIAVRLQKHGYKILQNLDAVVYTNTPLTLKGYYLQRNRWFKGGVFTALKHKDLFFNKNYGDFGLIQFPLLVVSGLLALTLLISTIYYSLKPNVEYLIRMRLVQYDFITFLRTLKITFNPLNLDFVNLCIFFFTIMISGYVLSLSFYYTREKTGKKLRYIIPVFIFFYFFLIGITWLGVVRDIVLRKKNRW